MAKLALLALIAGAVGLGGPALAQDSGKPAPPAPKDAKFQALDQNQDGMISRMEAHGDEDVERQFPSLDRDADGDVSKSEFAAFEVKPHGRWRPAQGDAEELETR